MGDQAPVGLVIQQLWKLRAILANSPISIPPERVFSTLCGKDTGSERGARVLIRLVTQKDSRRRTHSVHTLMNEKSKIVCCKNYLIVRMITYA